MRIPLSGKDYVNCAREVEGSQETTGIAALAHLLGARLRARLPALRPSGSIDPQIAALIDHVESASASLAASGSLN